MSVSHSNTVTRILGIELEYQPSALEFVPDRPDHFLVGSYSLDKAQNEALAATDNDRTESDDDEPPASGAEKAPQSRSGALLLFHFDGEKQILTNVFTKHMPSAVTDIRFCPHSPDHFAVTCTDGSLSIYHFDQDHIQISQISPSHYFSSLALSCVWNQNTAGMMAVTLDTGDVSIVQWFGGSGFESCKVHNLSIAHHESRFSSHEAWVAAFSPRHKGGNLPSRDIQCVVYSGGDDAMLRCTRLPTYSIIGESGDEDEHAFDNSLTMKGHDAGVTSILPIPNGATTGQEILITGSYDDHVRVLSPYDHRIPEEDQPMRKPTILAELNLGGGVWKLKFMRDYVHMTTPDPNVEVRYLVLASCMHAGARVLEVVGSVAGNWNIRVLGKFEEHKSMCYAADVQPQQAGATSDICVSSSFYDKYLAVWAFRE